LRIEDSEGLLEEYGEGELTSEELDPDQTVHTIQMDEDEREEMYREDLLDFMTEEEYEETKEAMKDLNPERFEHYITLSSASVSRSSFDDSSLSERETGQFYSLLLRNITQDLHDEDVNNMRVGLVPFVRRTDKEMNKVAAEVVDQNNNRHKIFFDEGNVYQFKFPGSIGVVDGEGEQNFGGCEFKVMRGEINKPWNKALDSINPDKLQGMFRDQLVGFTNWTRVHDELKFEGREEAEKIRSPPTPTPTPEETPTPSPSKLSPIQIAAHEPFAENYREAILNGDDTKKKQRFDLSDTLTDYVLNADHEEVYGLVVGGTVDNPAILQVEYENRDFFNAIHDLEANTEMMIRELANEYRATGEVPAV